MRKKLSVLLLIVLALWAGGRSNAQADTLDVLFIGNSLTFANDLPRLIGDMAGAAGKDFAYQTHAPGGWRLARHSIAPKLKELFEKRTWDIVVLQEQSQLPGFPEEQLKRDVYPYVEDLIEQARDANPDVEIVFYATPAHRNGDFGNKRQYKQLGTYKGMQKRINQTYLKMARRYEAIVAPVGTAWMRVRADRPKLNLYTDNVHPNIHGSYLAACVFYATIFGESPVDTAYPAAIDARDARYLQEMANELVLKSSRRWRW